MRLLLLRRISSRYQARARSDAMVTQLTRFRPHFEQAVLWHWESQWLSCRLLEKITSRRLRAGVSRDASARPAGRSSHRHTQCTTSPGPNSDPIRELRMLLLAVPSPAGLYCTQDARRPRTSTVAVSPFCRPAVPGPEGCEAETGPVFSA